MKENIIGGIAVIAFIFSCVALTAGPTKLATNGYGTATTAGNLLAENYDPYIMYNGGYQSAKDISTTGNLNSAVFTNSGASTFGGTVTVTTSNTATSTLVVGCIQTYATSTATPVIISATTTSQFLIAKFGSCPV